MGDVIAFDFDIRKWKERDWQRYVVDYATLHGWWVYHNPDSRRSSSGWPDLVLLREPECLFVELKTETGKVSNNQTAILNKLGLCDLETHVWRPRDTKEVHERLNERRRSVHND